ncbi:hypothetical protein DFH06DRAFT_1379334 [Mycena polygramma]|nr:hypothetical protein DFH06DRAFT_1379334 [Mycena polygramma]
MAVPKTYTMMDISGKYTLNKALSDLDASDTILEQQGVGLLKRKAISFAGGAVCIEHHKDVEGVEHLELQPQISGISAPKEGRVLTWTDKAFDHPIFGSIVTKSRRIKPTELDDEHLKAGWSAETIEDGVIQSHLVGKKWTAIQASRSPKYPSETTHPIHVFVQTWGIGEIDGEKRHSRHTTFTGPKGNTIHARMVYDYGEFLSLVR